MDDSTKFVLCGGGFILAVLILLVGGTEYAAARENRLIIELVTKGVPAAEAALIARKR